MCEETLIEKIKNLPPEEVAEVKDFVDFLAQRENRRLVQAAAQLSEDASKKTWDM